MANKEQLMDIRKGSTINKTSKRQEKALDKAVKRVIKDVHNKFPRLTIEHDTQWKLVHSIDKLQKAYPDIDFTCFSNRSAMKPDGGVVHLISKSGKKLPILISEKKNQGTNDKRASEGMPKQAKEKAIERLGKNVIGFRTAMKTESIFPFVCFGDGIDFAYGSTILDRVVTIAQFGALNKIYLHDQEGGIFDRGSFFFRYDQWTEDEMYETCLEITEKSIYYYLSMVTRSFTLNNVYKLKSFIGFYNVHIGT